MKILADECVFYKVVKYLRENGHDVKYIREIDPSISDEEIWKIAKKEKRIIITLDTDFGEIYHFYKFLKISCIIFRVIPQNSDTIINCLKKILVNEKYLDALIKQALLVVRNNKIRIVY